MNTKVVLDGARWLQILAGTERATRQEIDRYTDYLVEFVQELIHKTVPRYKPTRTQYSKPWWTTEVAELVAVERRARRNWTRTHTDQA